MATIFSYLKDNSWLLQERIPGGQSSKIREILIIEPDGLLGMCDYILKVTHTVSLRKLPRSTIIWYISFFMNVHFIEQNNFSEA